jgi:hypothetical protein
MSYLQRLGQILFVVPVVMTLSLQDLRAQARDKAPVFEGTKAVGPNFVSDAASGPPLQIKSTAVVTNLNADFLNGFHATVFPQLSVQNTFSAAQTFMSNVGIGTNADLNPLHVFKGANTGAGPTILIEQENPSNDVAIDFHSAGRLVGNVGTVFSDGHPRVFLGQNTNGVGPIPVAIAENGGNVGIGIATPSNILTG